MNLETAIKTAYKYALSEASEKTVRDFHFFLVEETFVDIDPNLEDADEIGEELERIADKEGHFTLCNLLNKLMDMIGEEKA